MVSRLLTSNGEPDVDTKRICSEPKGHSQGHNKYFHLIDHVLHVWNSGKALEMS